MEYNVCEGKRMKGMKDKALGLMFKSGQSNEKVMIIYFLLFKYYYYV